MSKNYFDLHFYKHLKNTNDQIKHIYKSKKKNQILPCIVLNKKKEEEEKIGNGLAKKGT